MGNPAYLTIPDAPFGHLSLSKKHKGTRVSAMSILSWSAANKNLQEKASHMEENNADNDENENKNTIHKMDYGKAVEKSTSHDERRSSVLGMSGGMSLQTDVFPLAPFLSAPLLTNYNAIDPLVDGRPHSLDVAGSCSSFWNFLYD